MSHGKNSLLLRQKYRHDESIKSVSSKRNVKLLADVVLDSELENVYKFEQLLSKISYRNIDEIVSFSQVFKERNFVYYFINLISTQQPQKNAFYAMLLDKLVEKNKESIDHILFNPLLTAKLILNDIIIESNYHKNDQLFQFLYSYFTGELKCLDFIQKYFSVQELMKDDFKVIHEIIENTYPEDTVGYIIKNDLDESLLDLIKNQYLDIDERYFCLDLMGYMDCDQTVGVEPSLISLSAFYGSTKCFKLLYKMRANMEEETLAMAVIGGDMEILSFMRQKGIRMSSLISTAVRCHHNEFVDLLLSEKSSYGFTLGECVQCLNIKGLVYCMKNGGDIESARLSTKDGWSVTHIAAMRGSVEVLDYLIKSGAKVNEETLNDRWKAIHFASQYGFKSVVEYLVENGESVNSKTMKDEWTPLHFAAKCDSYELVKYLLASGAEVNSKTIRDEWTPLHFACYYSSPNVTEYLLKNGANPTLYTKVSRVTPIVLACRKGTLTTVRYLTDAGANYTIRTFDGKSLLHIACEYDFYSITKFLLSCGCESDAKTARDHWTPLHFACRTGSLFSVEYLLEKNVDVNSETLNDKWTPLHFACESDSVDIVELLVSRGADIDSETKSDSWTPLHLACMHGSVNLVKYLVDNGSDPFKRTSRTNWSCLHFAARKGSIQTVKLLLLAGLDIRATTVQNQTPLVIARLFGHNELCSFLENELV